MSVNLTIIPETHWSPMPVFSGYNRLGLLGKWYDLWEEIRALPGQRVLDETFEWYARDGVHIRYEDCYGNPLRWVYARDLATVELPPEMDGWDAAVFAFVRALPPSTRILIYWW